jgi:hypothetical protein
MDPEPGRQTNADPCGSGSDFKPQTLEFLHEKYTLGGNRL